MKIIYHLVQGVLILAGICLMWEPVYSWAYRVKVQYQSKASWSEWKASGRQAELNGLPAAWLTIPSAGIDTLVIHEPTRFNLLKFPCLNTNIGDIKRNKGVSLIIAHRDMHFGKLESAKEGDLFTLDLSGQGLRSYKIIDIEILPLEHVQARIIEERGDGFIVLMTCYPFSLMVPADRRILFWAKMV